MTKPAALAIAAHPDDIELMMAGTLLLLGQAGYELHIFNIANGSCGTATEDAETIAARRLEEARASARLLGATLHEPLTRDAEIFYDKPLLTQTGAVVRTVNPRIVLTHSPQDYMEDHMNACRLAVSAVFCRGMRNFPADPPRPPVEGEATVYHALPWGLRDPLRRVIRAGQYAAIGSVLAAKREALACHKSQKEWLDQSQGLDSYLDTMEDMAAQVGRQSGAFSYAEGWRRHLHLGFCSEHADPLGDALGERHLISEEYEANLEAP